MHKHNPVGQDTCAHHNHLTWTSALLVALGSMLTPACGRDSPAKAMLKQYVSQSSCLERAKFTIDGDKDRPRMESFYKGKSCVREGDLDTVACDSASIGDYCTASMVEKTALGKSRTEFCVRRVGEAEYKIDWGCTVGWNETSLAVVKTGELKRAIVLRLKLKLGESYYSAFEDKNRWQAIDARDVNGAVSAYVRRDRPLFKELLALLQDGAAHEATVVVTHPIGAKSFEEVEIIKLIRSDWHTPGATELTDLQLLYDKYVAPGAVESGVLLNCAKAVERLSAGTEAERSAQTVAQATASASAEELFTHENAAAELVPRLARISAYLESKNLPVPDDCRAK